MKYIIVTKKLWQEFNFKNLDKRFIVQNNINSKLYTTTDTFRLILKEQRSSKKSFTKFQEL